MRGLFWQTLHQRGPVRRHGDCIDAGRGIGQPARVRRAAALEDDPMRRYLAIYLSLVVMLAAPVLVGCHTVAGAGQDVQSAGHAVTRGAERLENR